MWREDIQYIFSSLGGNNALGRHILPSLVETVYWEDISSLFGGNCVLGRHIFLIGGNYVLGRHIFPHWWKLCIGKTYLPSLVETVFWEDIFFPHWWKLCIGKTYSSLIDGNCVLGIHILPSLMETVYLKNTVFPRRWKLCIGKTYSSLTGGNCSLVDTVYCEYIFSSHWWKLCLGKTYSSIISGNCVKRRHSFPHWRKPWWKLRKGKTYFLSLVETLVETVWREDISLSYITPLLDQITLVCESGGGWTVLSAKGQIYYSLIVLGEGGANQAIGWSPSGLKIKLGAVSRDGLRLNK